MDDSVSRLEQEIEGFLASYTDSVISASRVINPLLDVWAAASDLDESVASPVAALLTALVSRELTTAAELQQAMDEVRVAAGAVTVPAGV